MAGAAPILEVKNLKKNFGGTPALRDGSLVVREGEIHALMGQNGAGKSTLLKLITGVYKHDSGSITFNGENVEFTSPQHAQESGLSPIYQEINLIPQLTVAENIYLGKEPTAKGRLDRRRMAGDAKRVLDRVGVEIDPRTPLEKLSTAHQQMVAIARALTFDAKLLIMDEPTSSLHDREVAQLFTTMRQLRDDGVAIVFVSHKLNELYEICESITILRDGKTVASGSMAQIPRAQLIATMLGRDPNEVALEGSTAFARERRSSGRPLVETSQVAAWPLLKEASVEMRQGQVLGVAGLLGSGRSELAEVIAGVRAPDKGELTFCGKIYPDSVHAAIRAGVGFVPEDRKRDGLVLDMSLRENITLPILSKMSRFGVLNRRKEQMFVEDLLATLQVKYASIDQAVSELSGGNQQKIVLGRALAIEPSVLVLDEPTRGVDVGAKMEIQLLVSKAAEGDRAVLLISSELEEVVEGSDVVAVIRDGVVIGMLEGEDISVQNIMGRMAAADVPSEEGVKN